ncbi:lactococcin 972 family bacteriocin [Actinoplanes sp. L3-i22]|uniref:lactococcin 972 family bacteriocin n=1 Tax=Actinoplanes sp. L3-i22 TaxID=2836373 RepID=UPI001C744153|nr:lactococcin 972 family bacteriocin [Actinoplanes sp. L3-i22]BCY09097.1 hypothetical protein L3i22_041850 [Actinoplanes sp. L3-i22]
MLINRTSLKAGAKKTAAIASLAGFILVGSASSAQAASGGGALPTSSGGVSPAACSQVSGGTWCRGSEASGVLKHCYSNYSHPTNYHSSTTVMGSATDKGYANAGYFSYSGATGGWAYTCYAYYNSNA